MVQVTTIHPGMVPIIIQDPGHGDSISLTHHILAGDSDGVIVRVGSVSDLVSDMDMDIMVMVTGAVAGGVRPFIIPPAGVAGMEHRGLMDTMEIHSMYIIMST